MMKNLMILGLSSLLILVLGYQSSDGKKYERDYQMEWCEQAGGVIEHRLPDRTRVDCLLDDYAIEFDFAKKWAEAIGQSLYYSMMTERNPGIVLILKESNDQKYLDRMIKVIEEKNLNIKVWTIEP